jgi:hypothetical protein
MFAISRGGAIPWPARFPDLSVCDYFIWGYLKSKVYLMKPYDIEELKNAKKEEIHTRQHGKRSNENIM